MSELTDKALLAAQNILVTTIDDHLVNTASELNLDLDTARASVLVTQMVANLLNKTGTNMLTTEQLAAEFDAFIRAATRSYQLSYSMLRDPSPHPTQQ